MKRNEVLGDEMRAGEMGIGERGAKRQILLIYRFWGEQTPDRVAYMSAAPSRLQSQTRLGRKMWTNNIFS